MAITNSRNTLRSLSLASFVSSVMTSLSHTELTLWIIYFVKTQPADKTSKTDDHAARAVLLLEGGVLFRVFGCGRVDGRYVTHQVGEGRAELVHGKVGQNGSRYSVVILKSRLQSEQALLNDVIVLFSSENGSNTIDVLDIRLLHMNTNE